MGYFSITMESIERDDCGLIGAFEMDSQIFRFGKELTGYMEIFI